MTVPADQFGWVDPVATWAYPFATWTGIVPPDSGYGDGFATGYEYAYIAYRSGIPIRPTFIKRAEAARTRPVRPW